ncbi:MAG: methionyl-tRNA formyltransferase [Nitrospirae bacterium]|nr:methionyl-tRNA formyltransferase [Nitrospirota bacterium]
MKTIFMGTPEFALPTLIALVESTHTVELVITQPDKKKGRGRSLSPPPVKVYAQSMGLKVIAPDKLNDPYLVNLIAEYAPDVIVVVAYGRILPSLILEIPKNGCVNLHGSLLPQYRGAAPIQWAIIDGKSETGVTTIKMDKGIDTGAIFLSQSEIIHKDDTYESLGARLSIIGAGLLIKTLDLLQADNITPIEQTGNQTYARILTKQDGLIDWSKTADELSYLVRGLYPWPCAYTFINGERVKIIKAESVEYGGSGEAGKIINEDDKGFFIGTASGLLSIIELQPAGKSPMSYKAFLKGRLNKTGDHLYVG